MKSEITQSEGEHLPDNALPEHADTRHQSKADDTKARPAAAWLLIESTSARLYTVVYPKQNAETVILLHGGPGIPMDFSPIVALLSPQYQVITFDQRGTGRSPAAAGATYSMDEYIRDIDAIAAYFGVSKFHLFGHSWGGLYAQVYAERNPQRLLSLYLCSPGSGTGKVWKQTENEVLSFNRARAGLYGWLKMGVKSVLAMLGSDKACQSLFRQVLENYNREYFPSFTATDAMVENARATSANRTRHQIAAYPPLKDAADYGFPVMVTYGKKDIYGESKGSVRSRYPHAAFVELPDSGHFAWTQNYPAFARTFTEFYADGRRAEDSASMP